MTVEQSGGKGRPLCPECERENCTDQPNCENLAPREVALGTLEGLYCLGCEVLIIGKGWPCYCDEELDMKAHVGILWCTEECLIENHEEPIFLGPEGESWSE